MPRECPHNDWVVPGRGIEPEEKSAGFEVMKVYAEAGFRTGSIGFTIYVLTVTEISKDGEYSVI